MGLYLGVISMRSMVFFLRLRYINGGIFGGC